MSRQSFSEKHTLVVYSLGHALIDAASAALVLSIVAHGLGTADAAFYIIIYNVLAFGLQAPLGAFADMRNIPKQLAVGGNLIAIVSMFLAGFPLLAVSLVGAANALFHVGGGVVSLRLGKGGATIPGIFVAPGAVGLFLGGLLGSTGVHAEVWFALLLAITSVGVMLVGQPAPLKRNQKHRDYVGIAMLLLLLAIASRSLLGFAFSFPWKQGFTLSLALVSGIALGKAAGGFLADRFGWRNVSVGALLVSAPLLAFGFSDMTLGIIGIFLFNFSMPVTLVAIARMLPGWEGFAFGLTTLSLIAGALLAFAGWTEMLKTSWALFTLIICSAAVLYLGLRKSRCED